MPVVFTFVYIHSDYFFCADIYGIFYYIMPLFYGYVQLYLLCEYQLNLNN